jgi:hypothetical protein
VSGGVKCIVSARALSNERMPRMDSLSMHDMTGERCVARSDAGGVAR